MLIKHKNMVGLSIFFILAVSFSVILTSAQGSDNQNAVNVGQNRFQGSISGNQTNQYTFQNRFRFTLQTNQSLDMDIDIDVDAVGDRNFQLCLNTTGVHQNLSLQMKVQAENEDIGLQNGNKFQHQNQNQYQYKEQFMVNLSLNASCTMNAKLSIDTEDKNAKWAYYNEKSGEFETVPSEYQNGVLSANTDHFSIWTVLSEDNDAISIPGFENLILFFGFGTVILLITYKKH